MHLSRRLLALAPLLVLLACQEPPEPPLSRDGHLDTLRIDPSLGIEPARMERVATRLYRETLAEGAGDRIRRGEAVAVHVAGWLPNGRRIVDTRADGSPMQYTYGVGQVVRGLDLGMQGMRPGERRRLILGPAMAYGAAGTDSIPPYSTVIYEVELLPR